MAFTKIEHILDPEILADHAMTYFPDKVAFIQSGAVQVGGTDIEEGGQFLTIPRWMANEDKFDEISETSDLTPKKVDEDPEYGVVVRRGIAYEILDTASLTTLGDPNKHVANKIANLAGRTADYSLISVAVGATPAANTHDIAVASGSQVYFSAEHCIDAMAKVGDEMDNLALIIMHSTVYARCVKNDLIDFEKPSEGPGRIPYFQGRRVIVSDRCPVDTTTPNYYEYSTFLVANGALLLDYQRNLLVEFDRDVLAQSDIIAASMHYIAHLVGMSWDTSGGGGKPAEAALRTTSNWSLAADDEKAVGCVKLITN